MRHQQDAVLTSLRRAQQFLDAHADVLSAVNTSTRKTLDDVVSQLADLSIAQDRNTRGSKGETARQRALRVDLRQSYMAPITELAKYKLPDVPELAALMLPPSNAGLGNTIASAYAMADAAAPHAQTLIDAGLPATFVEDLRTAAAAVNASIADRGNYQGGRSGATAELAEAGRHGRTILRVLNALIVARIRNEAGLLAEWKSAKAVRRKSGPAAGRSTHEATPIQSGPVLAAPTLPLIVEPTTAVAA